jgi:single-strand DNA-binding protein
MLQATAIGNLGGDAELRVTQSGQKVCGFSIAASGRRKEDPPTWIKCSLWGTRGEKLAPHLPKGSKVAVTGVLTTRDHNGKTYLELDVHDVELLGGKPSVARAEQRNFGRDIDNDMPF